MEAGIQALNERVRAESVFVHDLMAGVGRVIVGQRGMVERLLVGLLTGGHVLLEGVPGLAKTLAVRTLASSSRPSSRASSSRRICSRRISPAP